MTSNVRTLTDTTNDARGNGLRKTSDALRLAGHPDEADAVDHVHKREDWSGYATGLIKAAIGVADTKGVLDKLWGGERLQILGRN